MKTMLVAAVILTAAYFTANAQTKGTNTLGAGFDATSYKQESGNFESESKGNHFNLGYGRFIKDNLKLGVNGTYSHSTSTYSSNTDSTKVNKYGGGISLQKYFPLFNKFYAYAGGHTNYTYAKQTSNTPSNNNYNENSYFLGASGGVTWFVSKHFAFEVNLLSGGLNYSRGKYPNGNGFNTMTNFNVSTSGSITDLGFMVYFLF
ncbi:MAG TPA: outer membrane beta-barrel protein [Sphingobacteriaceae bacterium]